MNYTLKTTLFTAAITAVTCGTSQAQIAGSRPALNAVFPATHHAPLGVSQQYVHVGDYNRFERTQRAFPAPVQRPPAHRTKTAQPIIAGPSLRDLSAVELQFSAVNLGTSALGVTAIPVPRAGRLNAPRFDNRPIIYQRQPETRKRSNLAAAYHGNGTRGAAAPSKPGFVTRALQLGGRTIPVVAWAASFYQLGVWLTKE